MSGQGTKKKMLAEAGHPQTGIAARRKPASRLHIKEFLRNVRDLFAWARTLIHQLFSQNIISCAWKSGNRNKDS